MKTFTLIPIGGIANRVFAIYSAIEYCKKKRYELKIIWFKDQGLNAKFNDVFFLCDDFEHVSLKEASLCDYFIFDRPRLKNLWIPRLFHKWKYDRCVYEKELAKRKDYASFLNSLEGFSSLYVVECSNFFPVSTWNTYMYPKKEIEKLIKDRISDFTPNTIGLHIRRTDQIASILKSPIELFVNLIEKKIKEDESVRFYLASDSPSEKELLVKKYGKYVITSSEPISRSCLPGIIEGVVELYTLSYTKKIYGSYNSSYSELASRLNSSKLEILSI